jgi:diadenosine tetraphosphate (Ap4A) HIT family hydrolase
MAEPVDVIRAVHNAFRNDKERIDTAGQTVVHCHCHVIPKYPGDTDNPCGEDREVILRKREY